MAMNAPMMAIHKGMPTGMFRPRMMPVTTAERSPTGMGFFISRQYRYSKPTLAAVVMPTTSKARQPKIRALAATQGSRATTTLPIRPRVDERS